MHKLILTGRKICYIFFLFNQIYTHLQIY